MVPILAVIQSAIFLILALIHFNWASGSRWGLDRALPTNIEGERVLNPKWFDSLIIGFGLLFFAFFFLVKGSIIPINLPSGFIKYAGWIAVAIFLLRAIGDFKYVGFFKKIKTTQFAKADTKYFSPLCLLLSIISILIQVL